MLIVLFLCAVASASASPNRTVLAWWPTTNHNDAELNAGVKWFTDRLHAVTTASPTTHRLGPNSTVQEFSFAPGTVHTPSSVFQQLRAGGVRVMPILYNDESQSTTLLPKLREMFANPDPVVKTLVDLCLENDLDGWNLDFEVGATENVTAQDGLALAKFVDQLGSALAAHGKTVSLDIGTWEQPLWNPIALNSSKLGRALDMSTYGDQRGDPTDFRNFVISAGRMLTSYSCDKIGIGFCPACLNVSRPFTADQLSARFAIVETLECVQELDSWVNDIPDEWLPYLAKFLGRD